MGRLLEKIDFIPLGGNPAIEAIIRRFIRFAP
jgi:hypothetical protein